VARKTSLKVKTRVGIEDMPAKRKGGAEIRAAPQASAS
jgi:hypothetical protein